MSFETFLRIVKIMKKKEITYKEFLYLLKHTNEI